MKWIYKGCIKETEHRFLNFYTVNYDVIQDDGTKKDYSYFLASRNENPEDLRANRKNFHRADAVLIGTYTIKDGHLNLLLCAQFRPAVNRIVYSFPAGLCDPEDKDVIETAAREAREETGYEVEDCEVLLPPSPTSEGLSDECNAVVTCRLKTKGKDHQEEFEDIKARLYTEEEVRALLADPEVLFSNSARLLVLLLLEKYGTK